MDKSKWIKKAGWYSSAIFVVPFLTVLSIGLLLIGILFPIGTIMEVFGIMEFVLQKIGIPQSAEFKIILWPVPVFFKIPLALAVGFGLTFSSKKLWDIFKKYWKSFKYGAKA